MNISSQGTLGAANYLSCSTREVRPAISAVPLAAEEAKVVARRDCDCQLDGSVSGETLLDREY